MPKKPKVGRPNEGRVKLVVHVKPATRKAITSMVVDAVESNTLGKVLDRHFNAKV